MAEIVGLVASAVTLAATAHGAARFAKALFKVTSTFRHARKEMADIAQRLSQFSTSLQILADMLSNNETLCKQELYANTKSIILGWRQVEAELGKLLETPRSLHRFIWALRKPGAKTLLKNIEGIEKALMMQLSVMQLAVLLRGPVDHTQTSPQAVDRTTTQRKVTESVVQANRQVVESAQLEHVEVTEPFDPLHGKRAELDLRRQYSFDTATWLYHIVFGPSVLGSVRKPSRQPSASDEVSDKDIGTLASRRTRQDPSMPPSREIIVWGSKTEPGIVVDRLLSAWTTLTDEQIAASSAHNEDDKWTCRFLKMVQEAKEEEDVAQKHGSDVESVTDAHAEDNDHSAGRKNRKARGTEPTKRSRRTAQIDSTQVPTSPHVMFEHVDDKPLKHASKAAPASELPGRPRSNPAHYTVPPVSERSKRDIWTASNPRYSQHLPAQMPNAYMSGVANTTPYTDSAYRSQYAVNGSPVPSYDKSYDTSSRWSQYSHMPSAYQSLPAPPPPPVPEVRAQTDILQQTQVTAIASAEKAIRTAITDDPRLSRIESLLAAQQDNLARLGQTQANLNEAVETKQMSTVPEQYSRVIQGLEQLLVQQTEDLQGAEADLIAERIQLVAATEEHNKTVQALENSMAQMKQKQQFAKEERLSEVKNLKDQAERAVETRNLALKDAAAAQLAAETAQKSLDTVKAAADA
ncbi:uncharacterized protein EKO05_0004325 [Ascochyta rabiei]|uniref:uncharacterized protein n=1 Tax=Didymella rabiei TaxID=5454 RepID=UPI0022035D12|nr:uncharacterized protein EKO05_0004325 [Ascochyta rabiei]UPX13826.1 hypothetical protein EKO05_0004325 [Ascochyta rabiei]